MKAVQVHQFGASEVLKVEEISAPTPNPGQVLIRVHAAGVSPLDTYVREQSHGAPTPSLPYIPGFEAAGVIEAVGEGVTKFKTGDRVYVNTFLGAYAELIVHDAESVYPLPDCISFAQATVAVNSYPTAYYALFNLAKAKPRETVFVHGASRHTSHCSTFAINFSYRVISRRNFFYISRTLLGRNIHSSIIYKCLAAPVSEKGT